MAPNPLYSLTFLMLFECHSFAIHLSFVSQSYAMVWHSYALVCHPFFTRILSLVCARMSSICHSYVLVCHPYVTRMDSYVIRMLLLFGFTMNLPLKLDENVKLQLNL